MSQTMEELQCEVKRLNTLLTASKAEVVKLEDRLASSYKQIGSLRYELERYKSLAFALELRYSRLGTIDRKEEIILPLWIRNLELSRSQKWHITLHFKLSSNAESLALRLKQLRMDPLVFADRIERLYYKWDQDHHMQTLKVPSNAASWEKLFDALDVWEIAEKSAVQALLDYDANMTNERQNLQSTVDSSENDFRGFLVLKNVSDRVEANDLKQYLMQQLKVNVYEITMLMVQASEGMPVRSAGIAVLFIENIVDLDFLDQIGAEYCAPQRKIELLDKAYFGEI